VAVVHFVVDRRHNAHCGPVTLIQRFGSALNLNTSSRPRGETARRTTSLSGGIYRQAGGAGAATACPPTRFHGIFAPNAKLRAQLTPSWRGKRPPADKASTGANSEHRSPDEKRRSMIWAQRLKLVFNIDVSACGHCGSTLRIRPRTRREALGLLSGIGGSGHRRRGGAALRCRHATREPPIRAQSGACATIASSPACSKRGV